MKKISFNKKIIFLIVIIIIFVASIYVLNQKNIKTVPAPSEPIPQATFQSPYTDPLPPISFDVNDFNPPPQLPVYELTPTQYTPDQINEIAKAFGFETPSYIAPDDGLLGETYIYSTEEHKLTIRPKMNIIDYKSRKLPDQPIGNLPSTEVLDNIGKEYLLSKNIVRNKNEIKITNSTSINIDSSGEQSATEPPNVILITYQKNLENYPVYSASLESGVISIVLDAKLQPTMLYIDDLPEINTKFISPIKSFAELKSISTTQSSIQNIVQNNLSNYEIFSQHITSISIKSISIAYIQEFKSSAQYLQPVFVLKGKANLLDNSQISEADITLNIPAIK